MREINAFLYADSLMTPFVRRVIIGVERELSEVCGGCVCRSRGREAHVHERPLLSIFWTHGPAPDQAERAAGSLEGRGLSIPPVVAPSVGLGEMSSSP